MTEKNPTEKNPTNGSSTNRRALGRKYEEKAAAFLTQHGFQILEQNYRDRYGEIDIIARDGRYLVFIEVKYRSSLAKGYPQEAVSRKKQEKIRHTARYYLYSRHFPEDTPCRFDVVSVLGNEIHFIKNAF